MTDLKKDKNFIKEAIEYHDESIVEKGLLDTFEPVTTRSVNYKYWRAILDFKTCVACRIRHGQIYRIDEVVIVVPPLHDYCRCDIIFMESIVAGNATKNGENGADYWLKHFGMLPEYYMTENEAYAQGWKRGKALTKYVDGKMLTMGIYFNSNGHLPDAQGRIWYEADINYYDGKRNGHRVLWSNDGLIFVTYDHYATFYEII